jgi:hypothetical protein
MQVSRLIPIAKDRGQSCRATVVFHLTYIWNIQVETIPIGEAGRMDNAGSKDDYKEEKAVDTRSQSDNSLVQNQWPDVRYCPFPKPNVKSTKKGSTASSFFVIKCSL